MEKKNTITAALVYDFDGTLSPGNMQEYDFIPAVGKSNAEFWTASNVLAEEHDADPILSYMFMMLQDSMSKQRAYLSLRSWPWIRFWVKWYMWKAAHL